MTKDKPKESGTIFTLQRSTDSNSEIHVSEDDIDDVSWECADDVTKPLLQEDETDQTSTRLLNLVMMFRKLLGLLSM